jgi:phage terminase large subunit GpA-like protein
MAEGPDAGGGAVLGLRGMSALRRGDRGEPQGRLNARGVYVAPGQTVDSDGTVHGEPPFSLTISFWVSGLCSPFRTFGDRAAEYLTAVRSGDHSSIQTVVNGGFGEMWAPSAGDAPEWMEVIRKGTGSSYRRGMVPDGVQKLTLAADVQKRSIWWLVRGWGARGTSWLIDYGQIDGDTAEEDVWVDLAEKVTGTVEDMPIRLAFIDSGFRPGKVDTLPINRVYEFCRMLGSRVRPTKGSSTPMRVPLVTSKIEVTSAGKAARYGLDLVRLDTDHWKSWVHERLRWPAGANGAWYLPQDIDDDYARQIVSEARIRRPSGQVQWIQRQRDNHLLDCEAMAAAAGFMLGVHKLGGVAPDPREPIEVVEVEEEKPVRRTLADVVSAKPKPMFPGRRVVQSRFMQG